MADSSSPGLLNSLRELADGVVASAQDRIALLSIEIQEEKFRLVRNFVWLGAAFFTALLALIFVSLTVVFICEGTARLVALAAFAVVYSAAFAGVLLKAHRHFSSEHRPFAGTLQELDRDRSCIHPEN
jgi:uncharacterized membrane protein YqjE